MNAQVLLLSFLRGIAFRMCLGRVFMEGMVSVLLFCNIVLAIVSAYCWYCCMLGVLMCVLLYCW